MPGRIHGHGWRHQEAEREIRPHLWANLTIGFASQSVSGGGYLGVFVFVLYVLGSNRIS